MSKLEEVKEQVVGALNNPQHKWRSIQGISHELGVDPKTVEKVISDSSDIVVESAIKSEHNDRLFTTRDRWLKTASRWEKLRSIFRNKLG